MNRDEYIILPELLPLDDAVTSAICSAQGQAIHSVEAILTDFARCSTADHSLDDAGASFMDLR